MRGHRAPLYRCEHLTRSMRSKPELVFRTTAQNRPVGRGRRRSSAPRSGGFRLSQLPDRASLVSDRNPTPAASTYPPPTTGATAPTRRSIGDRAHPVEAAVGGEPSAMQLAAEDVDPQQPLTLLVPKRTLR